MDLIQYTDNGGIIDQWADNSGKVLDVASESKSNNAGIMRYAYTGNSNQQRKSWFYNSNIVERGAGNNEQKNFMYSNFHAYFFNLWMQAKFCTKRK